MVCWQVFLDMAVLVEAQGEMLDNIEANVSKVRACLRVHCALTRGAHRAVVPKRMSACESAGSSTPVSSEQ
jgi:hypothetical protein